jgi:hypothetical protein
VRVGKVPISNRLRQLIAEDINSVEQVEIVLLLRQEANRVWTPAEVNDRIKSSLSSISVRLDDLAERGFLQNVGSGFRYAPPPDKQPAVDELARAYANRRFTVIDLIFAKNAERLRAFARASTLRGDDDD